MGEYVKYLINNPDALKKAKSDAESAGSDFGSLEKFKGLLEYLSVNEKALSVTIQELKQTLPEGPKFITHALVYAEMGRDEEILQILEEKSTLGKVGFFQDDHELALLHIVLGNYDLAFSYLEKEVENKSWGIRFLKVHPWYDDIRSDPRFQILLKKMRLD